MIKVRSSVYVEPGRPDPPVGWTGSGKLSLMIVQARMLLHQTAALFESAEGETKVCGQTGYEPRTSDLLASCPTDCATRARQIRWHIH